jgi:hypothetical protein
MENVTFRIKTNKCENKWYSKLPSGITKVKNCNKEAIVVLNEVPMCQRCFNKRTKTINL